MHLLEMNNTLLYAHKIQIYGSNSTLHLKINISVSMTFFKKCFTHYINKKYETYVFKHLVIYVIYLYYLRQIQITIQMDNADTKNSKGAWNSNWKQHVFHKTS